MNKGEPALVAGYCRTSGQPGGRPSASLGYTRTSPRLSCLKVLDVVMGLHILSQREEIQGLDLSQHGEEGYIFI